LRDVHSPEIWRIEYFERGFVLRFLRMHHLPINLKTRADVVQKDLQITRHVLIRVHSSASAPCFDVWGRHTCVCGGHTSWDDVVSIKAYVLFCVRSSGKIYFLLKLCLLAARYETESIHHEMRRQWVRRVRELGVHRHYVRQSPSGDDTRSTVQEIPHALWTLMIHCRSPLLVLVLSHTRPNHNLIYYPSRITFDISR
jgi:hypothetical protein